MTLLELLARSAPARIVAADLLALVHVPRLDVRQQLRGIVLGELHPGRPRAARRRRRRPPPPRGGRAQRARLVLRGAAGVAEVTRGAGIRAGGPRVRLLLLGAVPV